MAAVAVPINVTDSEKTQSINDDATLLAWLREKVSALLDAAVGGGFAEDSVATVVDDDAVVAVGQMVFMSTGASDRVATLPAPATTTRVFVKKVDEGAGKVVLTPVSGLVEGESTFNLVDALTGAWLQGDGTNFWIIART